MARPRQTEADDPNPRVSVIARRLRNPFGTPSREIPLRGDKSSGWVVRTFSADPEHPNRHYDAVHRMGWVPLTTQDLAVSAESLGFTEATDGRVVRGPHGHEVVLNESTDEAVIVLNEDDVLAVLEQVQGDPIADVRRGTRDYLAAVEQIRAEGVPL